jgi:hypothetical protein
MREFADEYSRAQRATAMAEADHRHPDRIRALYLIDASVPPPLAGHPASAEHVEDVRRMQHLALGFKLSGMFAILGLLATIALTA